MKSNFIGLILIFGVIAYGFWKNYEAEQFMIAEGRKLGLECFLVNSNVMDFGREFPADVEARRGNTFYTWRHGKTRGNNIFSERKFDSDSYSLKDCHVRGARKF